MQGAFERTGRRAFLVLAALTATLVLAGPARAAKVIYPDTPTAEFGVDGTDATALGVGGQMAFNEADRRLYAFGNDEVEYGIFAFDASTPGVYDPLGPADGFPIRFGTNFPSSYGLATDETTGNIYRAAADTGTTTGFSSAGVGLPGFPLGPFERSCGVATDSQGHVWVLDVDADRIFEFSSTGADLGSVAFPEASPCALEIDRGNDDLYVVKAGGIYRYRRGPDGYTDPAQLFAAVEPFFVNEIAVDPVTHNVFVGGAGAVTEYGPAGGVIDTLPVGDIRGVTEDPATHTVYARTNQKIVVFEALVTPDVTTTGPDDVAATSATLTGNVDPAGAGDITACQFEWGPVGVAGYPNQVPCTPAATPGTPLTGPTDVSAGISGLVQGVEYHYRVTATNANGTTPGDDRSFQTLDAPGVESLSSSDLTRTTAVLRAAINPNGSETTYRFEYGTTPSYGTSVPVPDAPIGDSFTQQEVSAQLTDLVEGIQYHFRVVATNAVGTTASRDQTFNFFPPRCPNNDVRQQTGSLYLPDCRAYELVSPGDAGNVVLTDGGVPAPYATSPARFSFTGGFGAINGTDPTNSLLPDNYVATRTNSGWKTALAGIPGNVAIGGETRAASLDLSRSLAFVSRFAVQGVPQPEDRIPYVFGADGSFLGRWPDDWSEFPKANDNIGAYQPSPDFSHLAFSSNNIAFAPGGRTTAPGSAYDYDTETGETTIISRLPGGGNVDIPQEPGAVGFTADYILFPGDYPMEAFTEAINPGVSTDGSHILMATLSKEAPFGYFPPFPPQHLYMRVDNIVTYDVSHGHQVDYVGMTADGSRVYFLSPEQLTAEDTDNSTDLYMWSEDGDELTLLSVGAGAAGNGDGCGAGWTSSCDVLPVNGFASTDSPLASESGDIYFYSPELLDGNKGLPGAQNLYVYREGAPRFVAAFVKPAGKTCDPEDFQSCGTGAVVRIQVSPDGDHMAFVTASRVTSYDNDGFQEMYSYEPDSGEILCVSCFPDGSPPAADVRASNSGIFMSDDGRTFFSTPDPLVPQDTNGLNDTYEFVEGRAQLISSGTAEQDTDGRGLAGLAGVSADGVNVYFSTFDTLVPQDHNGPFRKFYVARTNGGFPVDQPLAACEAADECHGPDSSQPVAPPVFSDGDLGSGGNFSAKERKKQKARKHKRKAKRQKHRKSNGKSRHKGGDRRG